MKNLGKLLAAAVILLCTNAQAATYYVSSSGNDSNSGTSLAQAKRTIQAAIDAAASGDVVQVTAGETYLLDSAIVLKEGVNLIGNAFLDGQNATRVLYQAANFSTPTIVDGFIIQNGYLNDKHSYGAGAYLRSNVTLRNCIFTNNRIEANASGSGKGAGLYLEEDSNRVENCSFSSNSISNTSNENTYTAQGAGLYSGGRNAIVSCPISQNQIANASKGSSYGGGAYVLSQTVVDGCTISYNEITKTGTLTGSAQGGGIYLSSSTLKNSEIFENSVSYAANESSDSASYTSSDNGGGGVYASFSTTVHKNTIHNNKFEYSVTLPAGKALSVNRVGGGGLMCYSGNASHATIANNVVSNNSFTENIAGGATVSVKNGGGGGIFVSNVGYTTIDSCIAYSNVASGTHLGQGGAMYLIKMSMLNATQVGNINAIRCDVRNNSASIGGGIYARAANLISSLVANNTATTQGGGAYLASICDLIACSVVRNTAPSGSNLYNEASSTIMLNSTVVWGNSSPITPTGSHYSYFSAIQGVSGTGITALSGNNSGDANSPNFINPTTFSGKGNSSIDITSVLSADWQLQAGSLLVDIGAPSTDNIIERLPLYDLLHNPRLCNSALDIGAFEFSSIGCTAIPPVTLINPEIKWDSVLRTLPYGNTLTLNASIQSRTVGYASSNEAIVQITGSTLTARSVGVAEVVVYEVGNEQNFIQQTLTVTPRGVTVVAERKIKVKGEPDPALTYITMPPNALINGDQFSGALTRDVGEEAGVYNILQGTLSLSENYEITFVDAQFTINDESTYGSRVYYVKPDGMDSNSGTSWGDAKASIQTAMLIASRENPKAEVWVAAGRYTISEPLVMVEGVNVYGGFTGTTEESLSERPPVTVGDVSLQGLTIIDGNSTTQLLRQPYPFTDTTTWDGITFVNGNSANNGGGVALQRNGMLRSCNVTDCQTTGVGGGVMCHRGGSISSSYIARNRADNDGGGVYVYGYGIGEKATLENTTIDSNATGGNGGGIFASYQIDINRCTVSSNTAGGNGGGVHGSNATTLRASVVSDNVANGIGGGVYGDGKLDLDNTTLKSNRATLGGGIYLREGGTATLCHITDNEATQSGGGIYFYNGGTASTCNVLRNSAQSGGGVFFSQRESGTLRHSTVSDNTATLNGGGAYFDYNGTMADCIVLGNQSSENGGGVYFNTAGRCDSSEVENNSAASGGGIYVRRSGTFSKGILRNNIATDLGGGAFLNQAAIVTDNLIVSNQAGKDGGGVYSATESKVVRNRIINNFAAGNGGGIFCDKDNSLFTNLLANNTATNGGGAYAKTSNTITGCTFARNMATEQGGGIFYTSGSKMANSVAWGNSSSAPEHSSGAQVYVSGSAHSISYCAVESDTIVKDSIVGEGNLKLSFANDSGVNPPYFRSINQNIGASTDESEIAHSLAANWRLHSTLSACYNKGSNAAVPQDFPNDLAGMPRIYNHETVDMGAYEWVPYGYTEVIKTPTKVEEAYIYPNPTNGEINITSSFSISYMQIFSLNGSLLYAAPFTGSTLNLSAMPSGVLIIRVTGEGKVAVGKVVRK